MSVAFLTAAFAAKIGSASQKSVLVALADRADDKTGFCFPSVADLVDRTELDRKTVLACLTKLHEKKFLRDTGKRTGRTSQVKILELNFSLICAASGEASQKRNSSVFPSKESRFFAQTVPKTGHGTTMEPSLTTTTGSVVVEKIDELLEAAIWAAGRGGKIISNPSGFRAAVRKRILTSGASVEDSLALKAWRASQQPSIVPQPGQKKPDLDIDPVASAKGTEYFSIARVRELQQVQKKEKRA